MVFNALAGAFTRLGGMDWVPQPRCGWATTPSRSAALEALFAEREKTGFDELYAALVGES